MGLLNLLAKPAAGGVIGGEKVLDTQLFHHHIQSGAETGQGGETAQALPGQVDIQSQHGLVAVARRVPVEQGLHIRQCSEAFQQAGQRRGRTGLLVPMQAP